MRRFRSLKEKIWKEGKEGKGEGKKQDEERRRRQNEEM